MLDKLANISPLTSHIVIFFLGALSVFLAVGQSSMIAKGSKQNLIWRQVPQAKLKQFSDGEHVVLLRLAKDRKTEDSCKVDQMTWKVHRDKEENASILLGKDPPSKVIHIPPAKELVTRYEFVRADATRVIRSCHIKKSGEMPYAAP